jgi:transposase
MEKEVANPCSNEEALMAEIAVLQTRNRELEEEKRLLELKYAALSARFFGKSSEVLDSRQQELLLGELTAMPEEDAGAETTEEKASVPRRSSKRKPRLPDDLPTEDVVLIPNEVREAPEAYRCIGQEVTRELDVILPKYFCRRYIRPKFVPIGDRSAVPMIAPLPRRLVPGGYLSAGLGTDICVKKFVDHLPLYRQEQILKSRFDIDLSRKTMCDWLGQIAWWLKPIYNHIRELLRSKGYLQIDETPINYCGGKGRAGGQGYLWVYLAPGEGVLYEWHTSRATACLNDMLEGFGGVIQCDGYGAYKRYARLRRNAIADGKELPKIELAACWAHARRKFYDAMSECPVEAGWILGQIQHLYRIESRLRKVRAGADLRDAVRASESRMIVERLGKVLRVKTPNHRPKSLMGEAIAYTRSLWDELSLYLGDGRVEIDNNLVENAVRPSALGKKNWLFFGSANAGERAAIIYTLLENCKRLGINPQEYLRDALTQLPQLDDIRQAGELTPAKWAEARHTRRT